MNLISSGKVCFDKFRSRQSHSFHSAPEVPYSPHFHKHSAPAVFSVPLSCFCSLLCQHSDSLLLVGWALLRFDTSCCLPEHSHTGPHERHSHREQGQVQGLEPGHGPPQCRLGC